MHMNFLHGIVGYLKDSSIVTYCYNTGAITSQREYAGGIVGYDGTNDVDYSVGYCYNTGTIKGTSCVGGIVGAAWGGASKTVAIYYVYNTGKIINTTNRFNGGILGATYYDCVGEKVDTANVVKYGYSIGEITSSTGEVNQIVSGYATCTNMYYISGRTNTSGYGTAKSTNLFKAGLSNTSSVLYLLNSVNTGTWTIDSAYNSRLCNFGLAIKLKI